MTWGQIAQASIAVAAVGVAIFTLLNARRTARVERTLALHRDLTTGGVAAARDRFTEYMWFTGRSVALGRFYQPTFKDLLGPLYLSESDASRSRDLSKYPDWMPGGESSTPPRDLYTVLYCFERISAAFDRKTIDRSLLAKLTAHHVAWWDRLLERVADTDTMHRAALRDLATALASQGSGGARPTMKEFA